MKRHTHIYPRGANQWWCGGHLEAGQECWHITSASAEVCARNPTRYPSPSDAVSSAFEAGTSTPLLDNLVREQLEEDLHILMGCASCIAEPECAIGACLKARLAVRICIARLQR